MASGTPDHLEWMLTRLKLTAIRDQLDGLLDEAGRGESTIREALTLFCEREIAGKDQRRIAMSFGLARFAFVRDLSGVDFAAQPSVDKGQVRDLAAGRFIANGEAVLLLGPPGVEKNHLAVAIGREVIVAGYTVLFVPAMTLVATLAKARAEGRLEEKLTHFAKPKLLIVDELGYLPFEPDAAHLFFQLVSRRCERGALLVTSNRAIGERGGVFGDEVVATRSSAGCSTTATSSPSGARATGCASAAHHRHIKQSRRGCYATPMAYEALVQALQIASPGSSIRGSAPAPRTSIARSSSWS